MAAIAQSAWFLPQVFTANLVERLPRKKPVVINLGFFLERLPMWVLVLAALVAGTSPLLALLLFFTGYAWHGLGAGIIATAWQDLIARCFPVDRRGRFFGPGQLSRRRHGRRRRRAQHLASGRCPFPVEFCLHLCHRRRQPGAELVLPGPHPRTGATHHRAPAEQPAVPDRPAPHRARRPQLSAAFWWPAR